MAADHHAGKVITGHDLGAPTTWGLLPLERLDGSDGPATRRMIAAVAADLTTDAGAASRLEQELLRVQPALVAQGALAVAVWVPDPIAGLPLGHLVVELLVGDGTTPEQYAASLDPRPRPGQSVLRFDVEQLSVPAGPAVVVDTVGAEARGEVEEVITYVVFPDGTTDAMSLTFATTALHLGGELAGDARAIADTLTVTLGDGPA